MGAIGRRMGTAQSQQRKRGLVRAEIGLVGRREASGQVGSRGRICQSRGHAVMISKNRTACVTDPFRDASRRRNSSSDKRIVTLIGLATRRELSNVCVYGED